MGDTRRRENTPPGAGFSTVVKNARPVSTKTPPDCQTTGALRKVKRHQNYRGPRGPVLPWRRIGDFAFGLSGGHLLGGAGGCFVPGAKPRRRAALGIRPRGSPRRWAGRGASQFQDAFPRFHGVRTGSSIGYFPLGLGGLTRINNRSGLLHHVRQCRTGESTSRGEETPSDVGGWATGACVSGKLA